MGEWIRADLNMIGRVAGQITAIGGEFERATSLVDSYADALGGAQVAAALDSFAGNWAIHRQRLIDELDRRRGSRRRRSMPTAGRTPRSPPRSTR